MYANITALDDGNNRSTPPKPHISVLFFVTNTLRHRFRFDSTATASFQRLEIGPPRTL